MKYLQYLDFQGVSFSGGECFMVYDRMLTWLDLFKKAKPELYFWAYTNGLDIKTKQMEELSKCGLDELRFNIAATGYDNTKVLKTISHATRIFDHVAVEIPSIPEDFEKLNDILPFLSESGVDYLNLHEYILVPNDPNTRNAPKGNYLMNFEMRMDFHLLSRANSEKIRDISTKNGFRFKINNCSLDKKENQMLTRRKTMGALLKSDHEKLAEDGFLETVYLPEKETVAVNEILNNYHQIDQSGFIHPDRFNYDKPGAYMVRIMPKLGIYDIPKVFNWKKIT